MSFNLLKHLTLVLVLVSAIISKPLVLEPVYQEGENVGIIFIQGALISKEKYAPLAQKIQQSLTGIRAWVAITENYFDLPLSFLATMAIKECKESLYSKGLKSSDRIYLIGHSLGGIAALNHYVDNRGLAGAVMLGSLPERNVRDSTRDLNLLMIGGELDGLSRVTRTTEEFYHRCLGGDKKEQILRYEAPKTKIEKLQFLERDVHLGQEGLSTKNPVVVLRGLNHMSFASGEPSSFVKGKDLKAEVSTEEGHKRIANLVSKFINSQSLEEELKTTYEIVRPLITAYEMEGSIHFNRPDQTKCHRGYCSIGSEWAKRGQEILADKDLLASKGVSIEVSNDFVILSSLPPNGDLFHPKINFDAEKKIYSIKTFSQCSWELLDKWFDGGFAPTSASEIGSKLSSRQCSYVYAAGYKKEDVPLTIDTEGNICAQINKKSLEWALENSDKATVERYQKYGQKLNFVNDKYYSNGFSWTYSILNWTENKTTGEMDIMSYMMATSIDAKPLPIFAPDGLDCYHYCKLLSPARAMEWIYVDGLRKNYNIGKQ